MLIALRFWARCLVVELVSDGATLEELATDELLEELTTDELFEDILNDNLYLHSMKTQTDIRKTLTEFYN